MSLPHRSNWISSSQSYDRHTDESNHYFFPRDHKRVGNFPFNTTVLQILSNYSLETNQNGEISPSLLLRAGGSLRGSNVALSVAVESNLINSTRSFNIYGDKKEKISKAIAIAVGTAMEAGSYGDLATSILSKINNVVVVIIDPFPGNFVKTSPDRAASEFKKAKDFLTTLNIKIDEWFIGGHSAGGQAMVDAINLGYLTSANIKISGFIGLDPFSVDQRRSKRIIDSDSLIWSFIDSSCGVDPQGGGVGFHNAAMTATNKTNNGNRHTLYSLKSPATHCIFTDNGCPACRISSAQLKAKVQESVGVSIGNFVNGLKPRKVDIAECSGNVQCVDIH